VKHRWRTVKQRVAESECMTRAADTGGHGWQGRGIAPVSSLVWGMDNDLAIQLARPMKHRLMGSWPCRTSRSVWG
jgi:hypothetical protein